MTDHDWPRITRRAALGSLAAGAVGYAAFGPSGRPKLSGDRVVLNYWEKWTSAEAAAMRRVVDAFNASQSRIHVRMLSVQEIDQKARVAIAGGDPPDIVGLWLDNLAEYAEIGAALELDDLAAEHGLTADHYDPPAWQRMHHNGRMYAVVNTASTIGLYYNKQLFRESGLDPNRPPRTIEEMDRIAPSLDKLTDGNVRTLAFNPHNPDWWPWIFPHFFGGSVYDANTQRATADAPACVRAYEWVRSIPQRVGFDAMRAYESTLGNYNSPQQPFLSGRVAMTHQGPFFVNVINRFAPSLDYGVAAFPVAEEIYDEANPVTLYECDLLMIPRGCPHPREAFEFIAFTQRQDQTEALCAAHCKISPLRNWSDAFIATHPNKAIADHKRIARGARTFAQPRTPAWSEYRHEIHVAFDRIWFGQTEPEPALRVATARGSAAIDRIRARRERNPQPGAAG